MVVLHQRKTTITCRVGIEGSQSITTLATMPSRAPTHPALIPTAELVALAPAPVPLPVAALVVVVAPVADGLAVVL